MELIITSVIAFATTNIDDLFILMLFFGNRMYKKRDIVIGQYLGVGALIAISALASLMGLIIDKQYIGLLGLLPIYLGVKALIKLRKKSIPMKVNPSGNYDTKHNLLQVAAVTLANGGDNVGIYTPLFAALNATSRAIMIFIFLIMIGVWCVGGIYLCRYPRVANAINKYGYIITPVVLIVLGFYIVYENGSHYFLTN